jgi:hypothetical protein
VPPTVWSFLHSTPVSWAVLLCILLVIKLQLKVMQFTQSHGQEAKELGFELKPTVCPNLEF